MKRWIAPLLAVVVLVAAAMGAASLPAREPVAGPALVDNARLTLVCPSEADQGVTASLAVVSSSQPVRIAALGKPDGPDASSLLTTKKSPGALTRVSALRSDTFGAVSWLTAPDTAERGLSASSCVAPSTEQWFTGVQLTPDTQADVVLVNVDSADALVDITLWTQDGIAVVAGLGGITVPAGQSTTVPLNVKFTSPQPVALRVDASAGRVTAYLRQHLWKGSEPRGADWIPGGVKPARTLIVPGIPAGGGARTLVIANPGEDDTLVGVELLGAEGASAVAGADAIEVPAQSVSSVDLTVALAEQAGALRLTSTTEVTAGVILDRGDSASTRDPAFAATGVPLGPDGLWPVPAGKSATATLLLTNASDYEATASVTTASAPGKSEKTSSVSLPADSTIAVALPKRDMTVLRVQTDATDVYGVVTVTGTVGKIAGLAVVPLTWVEASAQAPEVSYDPRTAAILR